MTRPIWLKNGNVHEGEVDNIVTTDGKRQGSVRHPLTDRIVVVQEDCTYACWRELYDQELYRQIHRELVQMSDCDEAVALREVLSLLEEASPLLALRELLRAAAQLCQLSRDDPEKKRDRERYEVYVQVYEHMIPVLALLEGYSAVFFEDGAYWMKHIVGEWDNKEGWRKASIVHPRTGVVTLCCKHTTKGEWYAPLYQCDQGGPGMQEIQLA